MLMVVGYKTIIQYIMWVLRYIEKHRWGYAKGNSSTFRMAHIERVYKKNCKGKIKL